MTALFAAAAACAIVGALIIPAAAALRLAAAVGVACAFAAAARQHALLQGKGAARAAAFHDGGGVTLFAANGKMLANGRIVSRFVSPLLTATTIRAKNGRQRALLIMPDSLPADSYRQLRVCINSALVERPLRARDAQDLRPPQSP